MVPERTVVEMQLDEIGPSLRYATAQVTRQSSGQGGFQGRSGGFQGGQQPNQGYGNQGGQGGYAGGQGGYNGGYQGGGAGYSQQSAAPANPSAPAVDPWSNAGASDAGSFSTFGASSDFGGDDSDPEFPDQYLPPRCQQQSISRFIRRTSCHVRGRNRRSSRSRRSRTR